MFINTVTLVGNVVRAPEVRSVRDDMPVANFAIAWNRSIKKGEEWENEPHFFDIVAFGKVANVCGKFQKGTQVLISGELRQCRWTAKDTGQARSKVEILATTAVALGNPAPKTGDAPKPEDKGAPIEEGDIPF